MSNMDSVRQIFCPYCGEPIEIRLDTVSNDEEYVEDCSVCCRPIRLHVTRNKDGEPSVSAEKESE
jgi:hypothetical protein